jgi:hypothetical protein
MRDSWSGSATPFIPTVAANNMRLAIRNPLTLQPAARDLDAQSTSMATIDPRLTVGRSGNLTFIYFKGNVSGFSLKICTNFEDFG